MDIETFELLRDTVRRFVSERLIPAEDDVEASDAVPASIVQEMRDPTEATVLEAIKEVAGA